MVIANELKKLLSESPLLTLSVAESLTCGLVQARLGAVSGASAYFLGGVTAYSLEQKVNLLGIDGAHARKVNSVSRIVAEEMARGACALYGSDLAVATTGYAEPSPAHGVKTPMAWWALCHRQKGRAIVVRTGRLEFKGARRGQMQAAVTAAVLFELADYLREFRNKKTRR